MKRTVNSLRAALRLSPALWPLLLAYALIPALLLAAFGLVFIVQSGYLPWFVALLGGCSLLPLLQLAWQNRQQKKALSAGPAAEADERDLVAPSADWSAHDLAIWLRLNQLIEQQLADRSDWHDLQQHGLALIAQTAVEYDRKLLSFSVPELLKLVEEISRRYRQVILTHLPYAEKIQWSALKLAWDRREQLESGRQYGKTLYNAYRMSRIANPLAMLLSELRGALLDRAFSTVSSRLQYQLKQAFLQEVVSVAIDLYSGRFTFDQQQLAAPQATLEDQQRMVQPLPPLRVCLMGQLSAGKSSVINALLKSLAAEISPLPSTEKIRVYPCAVEGIELLHLVDLPGLDGSEQTAEQLLQQATEASIIIWVLKADQPARALDSQFLSRLADYFAQPANRSKKAPLIIGVLNQVDRLKPAGEWQPPYDVSQPQSAKARTICEALNHNQQLLKMPLLPLSVSADKPHYNFDALIQQIDAQYSEARNVQLNQMRHHAALAGSELTLSDQLRRLYHSGKSLSELVLSSRSGTPD